MINQNSENKTILEAFRDRVARKPNQIAIISGRETYLTYKELDEKSDRLAGYLLSMKIPDRKIVGIYLPQGPEHVLTILAILKSGQAFLSFNLHQPITVIDKLIAEAQIKTVVTNRFLEISANCVQLEGLILPEISPLLPQVMRNSIAYIIQTSGTTGVPKCIKINHGSLLNLAESQNTIFNINENSRVFQFAQMSFDASVSEWSTVLTAGATLYIPENPSEKLSHQLVEICNLNKISHITLPPSLLLYEPFWGFTTLKTLILAGEKPSKDIWQRLPAQINIFNAYGPSEYTVCACIQALLPEMNPCTIGRPIPLTRVHLVNQDMQPVKMGEVGEILLTGANLFDGYLHSENGRLPNPFYVEDEDPIYQYCYKTGDLAKQSNTGEFVFIGRLDTQVKYHGYRIELRNIEHCLREQAEISDAFVTLKEVETYEELCAYVIVKKEFLSHDSIQKSLQQKLIQRLNTYEIPKYFIFLEKWPLTENGKIDVSKLPAASSISSPVNLRQDENSTLELLILKTLWSELLKIDINMIHPESNFFGLGGDSITAMRLRIEAKRKELQLTVKAIYDFPILKEMANACSNTKTKAPQILEALSSLSLPAEHWFWEQNFAEPSHWNQWVDISLAEDVKVTQLMQSIEKTLIAHLPQSAHQPGIIKLMDENETVLVQREALLRELNESICPSENRFYALAIIQTPVQKRLIIVIHHLAVDVISWYLLIEEFNHRYDDPDYIGTVITKQSILPNFYSTLNQADWTEECLYWRQYPQGQISDPINTPNILVQHLAVPAVGLNYPILLATVLLAIVQSRIEDEMYVACEGHGRELLGIAEEASQAVGWWTSIFPFYLSEIILDPIVLTQKVVSELQRLPAKGQHFGYLKYIVDNPQVRECIRNIRKPKVCFNYLGRVSSSSESKVFKNINGGFQFSFSEKNHLPHAMEINAYREEELIHFTILYDTNFISTQETENFIHYVTECLRQNHTPLLPTQLGIWLHEKTHDEELTYIIQGEFLLKGPLDALKLNEAWQRLLKTRPPLRVVVDGNGQQQPFLITIDPKNTERSIIPFYTSSEIDLSTLLTNERASITSMEEFPLIRIAIRNQDHNEYQLVLTLHHIIADGWCTHLILDTLFSYYLTGKNTEYPFAMSDYVDWCEAQSEAAAIYFWQDYLSFSAKGYLREQYSHTGISQISEYADANIIFSIRETSEITQFLKKSGVTLANFMQLCWGLLLSTYLDSDAVIFGYTSHGRFPDVPFIETALGVFLQTMPVQFSFHQDDILRALLASIQKQSHRLFEFSYFPLHKIQKLTDNRFDTLLVVENYPDFVKSYDEIELKHVKWHERNEYPLTVQVFPKSTLEIQIQYQMASFNRNFVQQIANDLQYIITGLCSESPNTVEQMQRELLKRYFPCYSDLNRTAHPGLTKYLRLETAFLEQVKYNPKKVFCREGANFKTYEDLFLICQNLCRIMHAKNILGQAKPIVAVFLPRSAAAVASILAILLCDATYLPLETSLPEKRIRDMLSNAGASAIITDSFFASTVSWHENLILVDEDSPELSELPEIHCVNSAANLIYTSGTTGKPKGVLTSHLALCNRIAWMADILGSGKDDRILHKTSLGFDVAGWEIFLPIFIGGEIVIAPPSAQYDFNLLNETLEKQKITHVHFVPTLLEAWISQANSLSFPCLKVIIASGEALTKSTVEKFYNRFPDKVLYNFYGPTEAAIDATFFKWSPNLNMVPIGKPIANMQVYIVDKKRRLRPPGLRGELLLAGIGLAEGYFQDPQLTEEKFIHLKMNEHTSRAYCTGDLASLDESGNLLCFDRVDRQVKIKGYRIELTEIEGVLQSLLLSHQVKVICSYKNNPPQLFAFVISPQVKKSEEIRSAMKEWLPEYMIPKQIHFIENFPYNTNGKLDQEALLAQLPLLSTQGVFDSTLSPMACQIISGIEKLCSLDKVDLKKSFIEQGGDSILSIQLSALCRQQGIDLSIKNILEAENIESLLSSAKMKLQNLEKTDDPRILVSKDHQERLIDSLGPIEGIFSLTTAQQGILLHALKNPVTERKGDYVIHHLYELPQDVDEIECKNAWLQVLKNIPACRMAFAWKRLKEPVQILIEKPELHWTAIYSSTNKIDSIIDNQKELAIRRVTDLEKGHLNNFVWIDREKGPSWLLWSHHHILYDGWSISIILQYWQNCLTQEIKRPPKSKSFLLDYFACLDKSEKSKSIAFWENYLLTFPQTLFSKPQSFRQMKTIEKTLSLKFYQDLIKHSMENQFTLNSILLYCFSRTIGKLTQQAHVSFAITTSGRHLPVDDIENQVGLFIQTLPIHVNLSVGGDSPSSLQALLLKLNELAILPLSTVLSLTNKPKPLFDALFVFENYPEKNASLKLLSTEEYNEFSMTCIIQNSKELIITLNYDKAAIDNAFASLFISELGMAIENYLEDFKLCTIN